MHLYKLQNPTLSKPPFLNSPFSKPNSFNFKPMEIPVVNRISDFEVTALPSPSFPSQTFSISGIEKVYGVWTWGALILAVIASFGTIITRINVIILRRLRHNRSLTAQPLSVQEEDDFSDIDDDESYSVSTSSSMSDEEQDDEEEELRREEDFNVRGPDRGQNRNLRLRRGRSFGGINRFSWSDFASGKSVVKLWDNLALGLDLDDDSDDDYSGSRVVSIYDMNKQKKINSFYAGSFQVPAAASSSRSTILSADTNASSRVSLGVWDTRVGSRIPAMLAEWGPQIGRIVGVASGGVDKVYVKDGVTGALTVGDVRKVGAPLRNVTDGDMNDTWWDADAVIVSDECFDDESAAASGCDSAVTRCCSAVRSYLL